MEKIQCIICGEWFELNENSFYKSKRNKDGYDHRCKKCHKRTSRIIKRKNYNPEKAKIKSEIVKKDGRALATAIRMAIKYPEKYKAGYKLRNAVRYGKIKKLPCEICGSEKSQGHHDDYSKPLDVRWLCKRHHMDCHLKS